jgi:hypothetical protein
MEPLRTYLLGPRGRELSLSGRQMAWAFVCSVLSAVCWYFIAGLASVGVMAFVVSLATARQAPRDRESPIGRLGNAIGVGAVFAAIGLYGRYRLGWW